MDHRLRRNVARINHQLRDFSRQVGQDVLWYKWNPASVEDEDSADPGDLFDDDLYDESGSQPGRSPVVHDIDHQGQNEETDNRPVGRTVRYSRAITLRVLQASLNEGSQEFLAEGSYTVDSLTLWVTQDSLRKSGIVDPIRDGSDRGAHTNDRVAYDGRIFSVDSFNPRGRIADQPGFIVMVRCMEMKNDELALGDPVWLTPASSDSGNYLFEDEWGGGY